MEKTWQIALMVGLALVVGGFVGGMDLKNEISYAFDNGVNIDLMEYITLKSVYSSIFAAGVAITATSICFLIILKMKVIR